MRFPGPVTDAVVSPNGLDIAFVDGQGNIAVAHLDGTGVRALTATDAGVRRAQPTFEDGGAEIVFTERGSDGVWRLKEVAVDGHDELTAAKHDPTVPETESDGGHDTAPSAIWFQASHNETARSVLLFEHRTPRGLMKIYIADRNQRGFGASPLLPGRAPAVSPTGDRVAFIGSNGQIDVQLARPRSQTASDPDHLGCSIPPDIWRGHRTAGGSCSPRPTTWRRWRAAPPEPDTTRSASCSVTPASGAWGPWPGRPSVSTRATR